MSNGIYLTLEQYKDKDLPLTITVNGNTYHSQFALATTQTTWFEMGKQHGMELGADNTYSDKEMSRMHDAWYEEGYEAGTCKLNILTEQAYNEGYEAAVEAHNITITDDFTKGYNKAKEELEQLSKLGFAKGYEAGKSESYGRGWIEGHNEASIKQFDEYSVKLEERYKSKYDAGFNDGYEQCKHDGISKINLNTEPVEQTELSKEYDKGFTKGYEEGKEAGKKEALAEIEVEFPTYKHGWSCGFNDGFEEGKSEGYDEGYEIGKKANGISNKEIPGEYLAHIEEARLEGYKEGYSDAKEGGQAEGYTDGPEQTEYAKGYEDGKKSNGISTKEMPSEYLTPTEESFYKGYKEGFDDCREITKMLNKYGNDDESCKDCKEEPGRDDDDGEPIDDNQSEYDKGYYAGWEDGKNHIMQFIGNESSR